MNYYSTRDEYTRLVYLAIRANRIFIKWKMCKMKENQKRGYNFNSSRHCCEHCLRVMIPAGLLDIRDFLEIKKYKLINNYARHETKNNP